MDLSVLKGPAELLASRVKAFKNCLELATECLSNKDYPNAEMIYGGLLSDLHKDCIVEALHLNDLEVFSLHSCFAYSSIGCNFKSEEALIILNKIQKPIKLPLVPYLKAFVHIHNDRISFACDELHVCQTLLSVGYNFKPNNILNEDVVPEINDEFLKLKLNGLRFVIELMTDEDKPAVKESLKEDWMKLGKLCQTDFAKLKKIGTKVELMKPVKTPATESKGKKSVVVQTGAVKKTDKQIPALKMGSIGIQTVSPKLVNVSVQTIEKEANKQLMTAVMDIKNKINNLHTKKDNELKQLQRRNTELSEKLMASDDKQQERSAEFEFLKEQNLALERKWEESQKRVEVLQKLLVEQMQQKYNIQKNVYQLFEDKCEYKIEYLNDITAYLNPRDKPTSEECKQEVLMWTNTLTKLTEHKQHFEAFFRTLDDLILSKKFSLIKTNEWPSFPAMPPDNRDIIYNNFKGVIIQSRSNTPMPVRYSNMFTNYPHFKENFPVRNPNGFVNNYHTYNEDGRTTGSPNSPPFPQPPHYQNGVRPFFKRPYQQFQNRRFEYPPPPPPVPLPPVNTAINKDNLFQSEEELIKFLQVTFGEVLEFELLEAVYHVRDVNGAGTLIGFPKQLLVTEVKKILQKKKAAKPAWKTAASVDWHSDSPETRCCICFEDYDSTNKHVLSCKHEFHKKCITDWLKRQNACPVCRVHAVIDEDYPPLKQ